MTMSNGSVDEEKVRPFISGIAGLRTESDAGSVIQRWPKPKTEACVDQPPIKRESTWARATLTFSQHTLEETEKAIRPLQHMMSELEYADAAIVQMHDYVQWCLDGWTDADQPGHAFNVGYMEKLDPEGNWNYTRYERLSLIHISEPTRPY